MHVPLRARKHLLGQCQTITLVYRLPVGTRRFYQSCSKFRYQRCDNVELLVDMKVESTLGINVVASSCINVVSTSDINAVSFSVILISIHRS